MFGGKLDIGRREDLFFGLHPKIGPRKACRPFFWFSPDNWGNLDVGRREDLVEMMCLTVTFKF